MELYKSGYFNLLYDPGKDLISLALPDMLTPGLSEAEHCFDILLELVKSYQVQRLLLDSSGAQVNVDQANYHRLISRVSEKLKETSLKKVARLVSANTSLERMALEVQHSVRTSTHAAT